VRNPIALPRNHDRDRILNQVLQLGVQRTIELMPAIGRG